MASRLFHVMISVQQDFNISEDMNSSVQITNSPSALYVVCGPEAHENGMGMVVIIQLGTVSCFL